MAVLERCHPDKLKVFNPWSAAPKGTLIQMILDGKIVAGMRTEFAVANGCPACLYVLTGDHVGKLVSEHDLSGMALDLTDAVEIFLGSPVPFDCKIQDLEAGVVLAYLSTQNVYYGWGSFNDFSYGGVCLLPNASGIAVGDSFPKLDRNHLIGVALRAEISLKPN